MSWGTELRNDARVVRALAGFTGPELDAKLLRGAQAAGRVIARSIRAKAPPEVRPGFGSGSSYRAGDLRRSIRSKTLRGSPRAVAVGPMSKMRHLAIRATKPHVLLPFRSLAMAIGEGRFAEVAHHPGNHPHPWVEAGINEARDAAIEAARRAIFRATGFSEGE